MRGVMLVVMVVSGVALADLGPPEPDPCADYSACKWCGSLADGGDFEVTLDDGGTTPSQCVAEAADAGYTVTSCTAEKWYGKATYYCQPDETPKQGCSSVLLGAPLALLAVFGAWRTRKRA